MTSATTRSDRKSSIVRISARSRLLLLLCFALLLALYEPLLRAQSRAPLELEYRLNLSRPTTHLLEIELVAGKVSDSALNFVMPAWSPGRYAIYDFAKNVQEFRATGAQGQSLPWHKIDKQTWRVDAQASGGTVRVDYRVYANDLNGTFSQFDASHANVNGASVFMYVDGHKPDPLILNIQAPAGWKVISGFSESFEEKTLRLPNYDRLLDTPFEISSECSVDTFREGGKTFRVAVHTYAEQNTSRSKLIEGLEKLVRSQLAMMPLPDFPHYTFIFHFAPDVSLGDGMEHLNSTEIVVKGSLTPEPTEALELAAHEFFHLWNVKRLRPVGLGPFDYTKETYTKSFWFVEGLTSYYAYVHLLRSGIWDRQEFLRHLGDEIRQLEFEPGRALMSAESASFNAWFYDRAPEMQQTNFANSTISYYNKGAILGLLLDLEIRSRTGGRKSLDDVLISLYRKFYDDAPASDYGRGHGYTEADILEAVNAVCGCDLGAFFTRYVQGTDPLPYNQTLARAGLLLRIATSPGSVPSLGVITRREGHGLKVVVVRPGGAAERSGLSRDDLLIATDNIPLEDEDLRERLKFFTSGTKVPFTIERHGKRREITVTLDPPRPDLYTLEESPDATPSQVQIRNGWLRTAQTTAGWGDFG